MEGFPTHTQPREIGVSFRREMMATATGRCLAQAGIEVSLQEQTVFGYCHPTGQDATTFVIRAFCTLAAMKEATEQAIAECINHDSQLVEMGLLPAPKH